MVRLSTTVRAIRVRARDREWIYALAPPILDLEPNLIQHKIEPLHCT